MTCKKIIYVKCLANNYSVLVTSVIVICLWKLIILATFFKGVSDKKFDFFQIIHSFQRSSRNFNITLVILKGNKYLLNLLEGIEYYNLVLQVIEWFTPVLSLDFYFFVISLSGSWENIIIQNEIYALFARIFVVVVWQKLSCMQRIGIL